MSLWSERRRVSILLTTMADACTLVCCDNEKEAEKAVIVQFSNGIVKNTDQLNFSIYKNIDESNPRKKNRRMLVAETNRLSYVGSNFGPESMKCNNLCNYYVGVLNKQTMQMEVHRAQIFKMHPVIPGEEPQTDTSQEDSTYKQKVDSLIEAFGTNKQKRALNSRRLNQVGSETLHQAVAKAANNVIDQKGVEALQQEASQMESQGDAIIYLPPCHPDADSPEEVYLFDDFLSPAEYKALEECGEKMAVLTPEELQKMKSDGGCFSVVKQLENLPTASEAREKVARCAYYLYIMLKLARQRNITRKFGEEDNCPRMIQYKLLKTFTVESYNNGRVHNVVSTSMRAKLATHCLALLLHMGDMTVNLTLLQRDLGVSEARMVELAKSMGLTLSKPVRTKVEECMLTDEHRLASLILPLVKYVHSTARKKRKKMR